MKWKAGSDPEPSNSSATGNNPVTPAPPSGDVSVFSNAQNFQITDSSLVVNMTSVNESRALKPLFKRVAPNAILNAGGRADEVRCHPGTRTEVIGLINKWRLDIQNGVSANQIFWLSGPAGAGKSAIVQTVAETWKAQGVPTANFFFFRTDPSRSHATALISTLLYQIFNFCPAARAIVEETLRLQPRILEVGLDDQVEELICATFRSIRPSFSQPIVLLIDGLDECASDEKTPQRKILQALDKIVGQIDLRFFVLVASRAEVHISATFNELTSKALSIFLDEKYSPAADIQHFVTAEFDKIKRSHPHAALLETAWPSKSDIDAIVEKSSGQFIYAATAMRFIALSSAVPSLSLKRVQNIDIVPPLKNSPFASLDAFYTYILKQADDRDAIRDILSSKLLLDEFDKKSRSDGTSYTKYTIGYSYIFGFFPPICEFLQIFDARYTETFMASCISDISSIIRFHNGNVTFYHQSLTDFLLQQSRSNVFHIDFGAFSTKVLPAVWKHGKHVTDYWVKTTGFGLLTFVPCATPEIIDALLTVQPSHLTDGSDDYFAAEFFEEILRLHYIKDIKSYKKILRLWIIESGFDIQSRRVKGIPSASRYLLIARIRLIFRILSRNPPPGS